MRTKSLCILNKFALLAGTAGLALALALGGHSMAQSHSGSSGAGHDSGTSHESGAGHDSSSSHEGGSGGKKMRKGATGERGGGHGGSLRDVFKQMEIEEALDEARGQRRGQSNQGQRGGQAAADKGQQGGKKSEPQDAAGGPDDAPKPGQAGGHDVVKPDYGDLYIIKRDADGVPILVTPVNKDGVVLTYDDDGDPNTAEVPYPDDKQVYYTDADGVLQCCLPYTVVDGDLELDESLGLAEEAVFSRTSVVRSPTWVLEAQYTEFIKLLDAADSVTVDQTQRIVLNDEDAEGNIVSTTSVDSPLIYLALYLETLTEGTLEVAKERNDEPYVPTTDLLAKLPDELAALKDGDYTVADRDLAAIFLAAAMDKAGTATADMIVYLNDQLNVVTEDNRVAATDPEKDYVAYSDFTYDRAEVYADSQITVLVQTGENPDGDPIYEVQTVNVLGTVFADDLEELTGIAAYTQAVDDARAVIDYVHTYAPPETN